MNHILKYSLPVRIGAEDGVEIALPPGAQILSVQDQHGSLQLWAMSPVAKHAFKQKRRIVMFGTGHQIPADLNLAFISTVQKLGGNLVLHVFEAK